jgi:hypothetical protein
VFGHALLGMTALAYGAGLLFALSGLKPWRPPAHEAVPGIGHRRVAPGLFMLTAATTLLGIQLKWITPAAIWAAWTVSALAWIAGFVVSGTPEEQPQRRGRDSEGICRVWLLAAIGTQSMVLLTALLPVASGHLRAVLIGATALYLLGCGLYFAVAAVMLRRLTFVHPEGATAVSQGINLGTLALTALAGAALVSRAETNLLLSGLLPFIKGFMVLFWAAASWWVPLIIGTALWRPSFAAEPQLWEMAFSLGNYSSGTWQMGAVFDVTSLTVIARLALWAGALAWAMAVVGAARRLAPTGRKRP